jgi:hypothetical protein
MAELEPISPGESALWDALPIVSLVLWFVIAVMGVWISARGFWATRKWGYLLFAVYFLISLASLTRNQVHRAQSQRDGEIPMVVQSAPLPVLPGLLVTAVWLLRRHATRPANRQANPTMRS